MPPNTPEYDRQYYHTKRRLTMTRVGQLEAQVREWERKAEEWAGWDQLWERTQYKLRNLAQVLYDTDLKALGQDDEIERLRIGFRQLAAEHQKLGKLFGDCQATLGRLQATIAERDADLLLADKLLVERDQDLWAMRGRLNAALGVGRRSVRDWSHHGHSHQAGDELHTHDPS